MTFTINCILNFIQMVIIALLLVLFAGCSIGPIDSTLADANSEPVYDWDCDRDLQLHNKRQGLWSLSQVGCVHYGGDNPDKPAFTPAFAKSFNLVDNQQFDDTTECEPYVKDKKLYADCGRQTFRLGEMLGRRVKPAAGVKLHVLIDDGLLRPFDPQKDSDHTVVKRGQIGFTPAR